MITTENVIARHLIAASLYHLQPEYDQCVEGARQRASFIKALDKALAPLRALAGCLESKYLGKMFTRLQEYQALARKDLDDLRKFQVAIPKFDAKYQKLVESGAHITDRDTDDYGLLYREAHKMETRIWSRWEDEGTPNIEDEFSAELRSRLVAQVQKALERVPSPEDFKPTVGDDWVMSDTLAVILRDEARTSKTAVKTKPSYPHLTDTQEPTNPALWEDVLDLASGDRLELRIGDRTVHAPNGTRGYRDMPQNPKGIAWAVKQYNGFGGGWRGKKEAAETETAEQFAEGFFKRHPKLRRYSPKRVLDKSGGSGSHPEARQHGDEVWIFPKFWKLDPQTRDFVFAHELGHFAQSRKSLMDLVNLAQAQGVDVWDPTSLPFGQHNMEEAFADSFASYHLNPGELKRRYPQWVPIVEGIKTAAGRLPQEKDMVLRVLKRCKEKS